MTNLVYRSSKNGSALVYEGALNTGDTYSEELTTAQNSVAVGLAYTITRAGSTKYQTCTANQRSQPTVAKARDVSLTVNAQSVIDLYTDTSLEGALTLVAQSSVASASVKDSDSLAAAQVSAPSLEMTIIPGSSHSTFYIELIANQVAQPQIGKDLQVMKSVRQPSTIDLALLNEQTGNSAYSQACDVAQCSTASLGILAVGRYFSELDAVQYSVATLTMMRRSAHEPVFEDNPQTTSRTGLIGGRLGEVAPRSKGVSKLD